MSKRHRLELKLPTFIAVLSIALGVSIFLAVSLGPVKIPILKVWGIIFYRLGLADMGDWSSGTENIVWLIRLPRVLLALIVGGGLAIVGVTLQAIVRNPLADSYILGVSSGASVGAVLAIEYGLYSLFGHFAVSISGFIGALITIFVVYFLSSLRGVITSEKLILSGIGVGYMFSGITSYITLTSDNRRLAGEVLAWTIGSLARASWEDLLIPTILLILGSIYLVLQGAKLNAISVGDETAVTLGINLARFRRNMFLTVSLITGIMVAVSGAIGFIGLMVPHMVRFIVKTDHRRVLPISAFVGSILLIWFDVFARGTFAPVDAPIELPVGVITSVLGGPFFLWLMWQSHRNHERKKL